MQDGISDNLLMESTAKGDAQAFRMLVVRHLPRAHAIARQMLYSQQDAEEAAQDAFCKVWTHALRFDPARAKFSTWFYRILANTCLDMLRRKPSPQISLSGLEDVLQDTGENQDAQIISLQKKEKVRQAVQFLPDRQRMAVVLCYFEEMSNQEAAVVMGIHIKALEGLLVRARKKLRERLGEAR